VGRGAKYRQVDGREGGEVKGGARILEDLKQGRLSFKIRPCHHQFMSSLWPTNTRGDHKGVRAIVLSLVGKGAM
jgi:hypothetical protein